MNSNIFNHNRLVFEYMLNKSEYWDHHLAQNEQWWNYHTGLNDDCLSSFIDTDDSNCIGDKKLISKDNYKWSDSINKGITLYNIGLTGVDNGLFTYDKNSITYDEFIKIFTKSEYTIQPNDFKLYVNEVSGNNDIYKYPVEITNEDNMTVSKLNGGFYQGILKANDGCEYNILPTELGEGLTFEFMLKKSDFKKDDTIVTINDIHPENKGIFFYLGTRAENKWWKYYKVDREFEKSTFYNQNNVIESNNNIIYTKDGNNTEQANIIEIETDNKNIFFNHTEDGFTTKTWNHEDEPTIVLTDIKKPYNDNYFMIMNHTDEGYTIETINNKENSTIQEYNLIKDLYRNALAFKITDDGKIGYLYLLKDCDKSDETGKEEYKIENEFSLSGIIPENKWFMITIQLVPSLYYRNTYFNSKNNFNDMMRIKIFVNGYLKFISKELPIINLKKLNETFDKQEGVPYNISIGGGTQGLCDTIYKDYKNIPEYVLPLEKNFAGSFIGYIKIFRFYSCILNLNQIRENLKFDKIIL